MTGTGGGAQVVFHVLQAPADVGRTACERRRQRDHGSILGFLKRLGYVKAAIFWTANYNREELFPADRWTAVMDSEPSEVTAENSTTFAIQSIDP